MIKIDMDRTEFTLDITGHADEPEEGTDPKMICCAVSTLAQALIFTLEEKKNRSECINKIDYSIQPGDFHLKVRAEEYGRVSVISRFNIIMDGFDMLEKSYPKNIKLNIM